MLIDAIKSNFTRYWDDYYDQLRYGKTLLNFGDNEQRQITAWKRSDQGTNNVLVRLADALPPQYEAEDRITVV